jgi:hypothetical protein
MARKKQLATYLEEDPKRVMREIVDALNHGSAHNPRLDVENHARLLRAIKAWKESGPDLFKMKIPEQDRFTLLDTEQFFEFRLVATHSGRAYISLTPTGKNYRDIVQFYFGRLILCPLWSRLGGPCPTCSLWYVKKTERNSQFCSRKCAGDAVKARSHQRIHDRKLNDAQRALKNYRTRGRRYRNLGWRDFVSQATGVSKTWLTRAANNGDLIPPR